MKIFDYVIIVSVSWGVIYFAEKRTDPYTPSEHIHADVFSAQPIIQAPTFATGSVSSYTTASVSQSGNRGYGIMIRF